MSPVLRQARKRPCISVLVVLIIPLFLRLYDEILELFWQCVSFPFTLLITSKWYIQIIWHPKNDQCSSLRHSYHVDWLIVEWVSDCYITPHELFYSCTLARTRYIRWDDDDDDIWFVLDQPAELDCVVLAHCSNSPRVDMSLHSDTLSWLRATQSALTPQWYVLIEATKTNCIVFGLKRQRHLRPYTLINCRQNLSDHCKLYIIFYTS